MPGVAVKRVRHDAQMSNDVASAVLVDGFLYGFDLREMQASPGRPSRGTFRCIDSRTGSVRWSSDRPGQASMVVADGKLLMLNDSGQALLVRIDPNRYEELGRVDVFPGETCWTAPALYRGRLYLRSPTRAACLFVGRPERMSPRQRELAVATLRPAAAKPARAEATWLIGAEREFPFEMPDLRELTRWYGFALCALAAAAVAAGLTHATGRIAHGRWSRIAAAMVFWSGLVVFGIIATPLANRYAASGFVFTWPLALVAVQQIALAGVIGPQRPPAASRTKAAEWAGFAGAAVLVVACLLYYKLTRQASLAPAWYFLAALPAAWPIAVPAARRLRRPGRLAADVLWMLAILSACFWAAGGIMLWRTASM